MNDQETSLPHPQQQTPPAQVEPVDITATTQSAQDPWNLLMNAGSDGGIWLLLGGPFALLVLIACVYAVIVSIKRRKENREFIKQVEEAEDPRVVPLPTSPRDSALKDQVDALTGQPIKPYKIPGELEQEIIENRESSREKADVRTLFPSKAPTPQTPERVIQPKTSITATPQPREIGTLPLAPTSLRERLRQGLAKTRDAFESQFKRIFSSTGVLDEGVLEQLHETLYRADFGVETADHMVQAVKTHLRDNSPQKTQNPEETWLQVRHALRHKAQDLLTETHQKPLKRPEGSTPWVILIVGVNGVGKTTTIGKLANHFKSQGQSCLLVAADTFRAAAIEQLSIWGERLGIDVIRHQSGADPAAVAFDGIKAGIARKTDVVIIDTAGRLHAKADLMAELGKINRILSRDLPGAPHETWLVLDATTGQNAVQQVKAFKEVVNLSGLVVTKLDGTAKGGVIVGITQQFKIPVRFVGVGEKADDLRPFSADEFAESLF